MVFVRSRTRKTKQGHLRTYTELVQTWREGNRVHQRVLCNLHGYEAPELALIQVMTGLERELRSREEREADFQRGWRKGGLRKSHLRRLTDQQIARERRASDRRMARLQKDRAALEQAIQAHPTPPERLRELLAKR